MGYPVQITMPETEDGNKIVTVDAMTETYGVGL